MLGRSVSAVCPFSDLTKFDAAHTLISMRCTVKVSLLASFRRALPGVGSLQNLTAFPLEQGAAHGEISFPHIQSSSAFGKTRR